MSDVRRLWHGTPYLLVGLPLALLSVPLAVLTTLAMLLTVVLVGGLLLAVLGPVVRALAGLQRRRTGRWTGNPVPELYARTGGTLVTRVEATFRDPATWRDLLWLWTFAFLGLVGGLLCWVPWLAPRLANLVAGASRRLLSPTARAMRRAAERERRQIGGHGLVGMQERIATLGGTLYAGPRVDGGYEVLVEIPLTTSDAVDPVDPVVPVVPVEPVEPVDNVETVEASAEGPAEQAAPGRVGA
jgi:hypothetical protein